MARRYDAHMSRFATKVYRIVRRVPHGRVISYGAVAALAGAPQAARAVGTAMRTLPDGNDVPWWRVVNGKGEISTRAAVHGERVQRALLEAERVRFDRHGRIDMDRFGWNPERASDPDERRPSVKRSAAVAILEPGKTGRLLLVRRPANDPDLPRAWGLPAASLRRGETWEAAARRAVREKLGVSIRLGRMRREGETQRSSTRLRMRLFEANLTRGTPDVHQKVDGVTRYTACRWADPHALAPAARRGSLCCRLGLEVYAANGFDGEPRSGKPR
jgi:methylated-DNA-protein-cysteine methyltransferase-like protein